MYFAPDNLGHHARGQLREATLAPARDRRGDADPTEQSTNPTAALSRNRMILPSEAASREAGKLAMGLRREFGKLEFRGRHTPCAVAQFVGFSNEMRLVERWVAESGVLRKFAAAHRVCLLR